MAEKNKKISNIGENQNMKFSNKNRKNKRIYIEN